MEQESQMIQGTVLAVIYQNPENGKGKRRAEVEPAATGGDGGGGCAVRVAGRMRRRGHRRQDQRTI